MTNQPVALFLWLILLRLPAQAALFPADSTQPTRPSATTATRAELNIRINYTSRAVFSGRDFGIRQWMSTPSITYYAKSGFYADLSGYYFSQSQPHYELTALSLGYLGILSNSFAFSGELSRTFLNQNKQQAPNILPYSADASVTYNLSSLLSTTADYNLLFGNATAHRFRLSVSGYAAKSISTSSLGLKRISFIPAVTAILGTETSAYNLYQPSTTAIIPTAATTRLTRIRQRLLARQNAKATATDSDDNVFGLMALDLSVPVRITFTGFRIGLTNHLVRPFKLYADEELSTAAIYYADVSLTWIVR